ncbi:MAG: hypothetical protein HYZ28_01325 [Myxococcales bacterium]|nr:hypothetical protein [Myxococcales bacterium]
MVALALAVALALSGGPAAKKTQLKIEIKPAEAVLYVDGKKKGTGAKTHLLTVEPGRHNIRVVHHKDEHSEVVSIKKGEVKTWQWAFEDDRMDKKRAAEEAKQDESEAKPETGEELKDPDLPK